MRYLGLVFVGMVLSTGQASAFLEKDTCKFLEDRIRSAMGYYEARFFSGDISSTNSVKREDARKEIKVALESAHKHSTVYIAACKDKLLLELTYALEAERGGNRGQNSPRQPLREVALWKQKQQQPKPPLAPFLKPLFVEPTRGGVCRSWDPIKAGRRSLAGHSLVTQAH